MGLGGRRGRYRSRGGGNAISAAELQRRSAFDAALQASGIDPPKRPSQNVGAIILIMVLPMVLLVRVARQVVFRSCGGLRTVTH